MIQFLSKTRNKYLANWGIFECSFVLVMIALGIFFRWVQLDTRPFHHDESMHAIFGRYFFWAHSESFYRYDPMTHGPLLYFVIPFFYKIFGVSKFAARAVVATFGTLLIFAPILFHRYLKKEFLILLISCVALSPVLIYWSRFIIHDYLSLFAMFLMLIACTEHSANHLVIRALLAFSGIIVLDYVFIFTIVLIILAVITPKVWLRPILFGLGVGLLFCVKANSYLVMLLLMVYLGFEYVVNKYLLKNGQETLFETVVLSLRKNPKAYALSFALCVFVFIDLYSAGFRYSSGILDGLFRKSLPYWISQNKVERLGGPFSYHLFVLSWYELLFILALIGQVIHFYFKKNWVFKVCILWGFLTAFILHWYYRDMELAPSAGFWNFFKIKMPIDFYLFFFLIIHSILVTVEHLKEQKKHLAFFAYFFFGTFFIYSYVGEKVPWLSTYILISGLIYLILYFNELDFKPNALKIVLALSFVVFVWNYRGTYLTVLKNAGLASELISQVHTSNIYEDVIINIQKIAANTSKEKQIKVYAHGDTAWPLTWYMSDQIDYQFGNLAPEYLSDFNYVFANHPNRELERKLAKTHIKQIIPINVWWVPDYRLMDWPNFLEYAWDHTPWNSTGSRNILYFVKFYPM